MFTESSTSALGRQSTARKKTGRMISTPVQQQRMPRVLSVKFFFTNAKNCADDLYRGNRVDGMDGEHGTWVSSRGDRTSPPAERKRNKKRPSLAG